MAKGLAYLRGRNKVEIKDLEDSFPVVFYKRIKLMEEEQIPNKFEALRELFKSLLQECTEAREAIELAKKLRQKYNENDYERLKKWVNAKAWLAELIDEVNKHYEDMKNKLAEKLDKAESRGDKKTMAKIILLAKKTLPKELYKEIGKNLRVEINLNAETLAEIAKIDKELFRKVKVAYDYGAEKCFLDGVDAALYILAKGEDKA